MKRVTGIGGIFFNSPDPVTLTAWYKKHLGVDVQSWGGTSFTWTDGEGQPYAGWYMEHAGRGTFQPCGQPQQWRVTKSAELAARAKSFGLDQDTPIYARLKGTVHGDEIEVMRIEQFGSLTPVANCGLTGVVIPAAPSPGK